MEHPNADAEEGAGSQFSHGVGSFAMLKEYQSISCALQNSPDMPLAPGLVKHEGEPAQEKIIPKQHHRPPAG